MANRTGNIFDQYLNELPAEVRARMNDEISYRDTGDEKVKITENDEAAGKLGDKLVAGTNVTLTVQSPGAYERMAVAAADPTVKVSLNDTTAARLSDKIVGGENITLTVLNEGANEQISISTAGEETPNAIAKWDIALVRYFLVDYDGGSDSNLGYVDAAAGSTIVPTGKALKTLEQLMINFPKIGNGRSAVIMIKPRSAGAIYKRKDGSTDDYLDFAGVLGYKLLVRRGSTDLTNSTTDRILCGGLTALAGPGGSEEWTCASGCTSSLIITASGSLTAEPGIIGKRVRFTGNVTAGLANKCWFISANTTSQITPGSALSPVPAAGDTFYIEQPGVQISSFSEVRDTTGTVENSSVIVNSHSLVGVGVSNTSANKFNIGSGAAHSFIEQTASGCTVTSIGSEGPVLLSIAATYYDEAFNLVTTGAGLRSAGGLKLRSSSKASSLAIIGSTEVEVGNHTVRTSSGSGDVLVGGGGSYFRGSVTWSGGSQGSVAASPSNNMFGGSDSTYPARCIASSTSTKGFYFLGGNTQVAYCKFEGNRSANCIDVDLKATNSSLCVTNCTGNTNGYAGAGIGLHGKNNIFFLDSTNTVTGGSGDVTLTASFYFSHSHFQRSTVVDDQNNFIAWLGETYQAKVSPSQRFTANGNISVYHVVRLDTGSNNIVHAQADSEANSTGVIGVSLNAPNSGDRSLVVVSGYAVCQFGSDPSAGPAIVYLDPTTPGHCTTTPPVVSGTNQKLRIGKLVRPFGSSTGLAIVKLQPELLPILADGNP